MSTTTEAAPTTPELAPVAEDMSAYIIAGAVTSEREETEFETVSRTPAQGIDDGVEAERLGFRRIWLSERIDIKNADVILSGVGARTSRLPPRHRRDRPDDPTRVGDRGDGGDDARLLRTAVRARPRTGRRRLSARDRRRD